MSGRFSRDFGKIFFETEGRWLGSPHATQGPRVGSQRSSKRSSSGGQTMTRDRYKNMALLNWGLAVSCLWVASSVAAAPPWADLITMRQVEADAQKSYPLTQENGPWMIMATTFQGPAALEDAGRLVHELRSRFKLPAYLHRKEFDYTDSLMGRGIDKYGEPRKMRHQKSEKIQEVAVLVGDYPSVDDGQAQRDLQKIKTIQPTSLAPQAGRETSQTFSGLRQFQRRFWPAHSEKRKQGPMRLALVTTNPLLPDEYFRPGGVDGFVEKLNSEMPHTLLDCPGQFTVKVATFNGLVAVSQEGKQAALSQRHSRLEEAAEKAHRLTIALRAKGYEAYQFHDRRSSLVTVGSFQRPGIPRPGGSIEHEPQVVDLIRRFGAKQQSSLAPGSPQAVRATNLEPQSLQVGPGERIPFDVVPSLIEVPRRAISADYAGPSSRLR